VDAWRLGEIRCRCVRLFDVGRVVVSASALCEDNWGRDMKRQGMSYTSRLCSCFSVLDVCFCLVALGARPHEKHSILTWQFMRPWTTWSDPADDFAGVLSAPGAERDADLAG